MLKYPAMAKQSNSKVELVYGSSVKSSPSKGWRVFWRPVNNDK